MTADVDRLSGCSRMKSLREPSYLRAFIPVLRSDLIAILRAASSRASSTASASCSPFRAVDGLILDQHGQPLHCLRILFSVPTSPRPVAGTARPAPLPPRP